MRHPVAVRGLVILIALFVAAAGQAGTWLEEQTLDSGGLTRYYRAYVPDDSSPGMPLVLLLHGGGGDYVSLTANGPDVEWIELADEQRFLLVVPNGVNRETGDTAGEDQAWNDCRSDLVIPDTTADDVGFLADLIDWAIAAYAIDTQRVYVTGASNGGMMSYRAAFELGHRVAAIAAFIANLPAVSECAEPVDITPVAIFNGDAEAFYMPWEGGCVASAECERGTVLSAEQTRDFWLGFNAVSDPDPEVFDFPDIFNGDGSTVRRTLHQGGLQGSSVSFHRVFNGGHSKPTIEHPFNQFLLTLAGLGIQNRDIESARESWAFLSQHTLDGAPPASSDPGVSAYLRIAALPSGELEIRWTADCGAGQGYGLYRGDLDLGYDSLAPLPDACDLSDTAAIVAPRAGVNEFFLAVPNTGAFEGDYGSGTAGKRTAAPGACYPQAGVDSCAAGF